MLTGVASKFRKLTFLLARGDALWLRGLRFGVGAAIEHAPILRNLSDIRTVVDVGANRGQFALAVKHYLPTADLICFEPLNKPSDTFRRVFFDHRQVELYQAAIGATTQEVEMHVSTADDSSSLLPIGHTQSELFPGTEESHLERVTVAPLDAFLGREELGSRALLKIDVQGYELEVLKGSESLLNQFLAVYVECSFVELYEGQPLAHEVTDWLHERELYLADIGSMTRDKSGKSVQGDFLFLRQDG